MTVIDKYRKHDVNSDEGKIIVTNILINWTCKEYVNVSYVTDKGGIGVVPVIKSIDINDEQAMSSYLSTVLNKQVKVRLNRESSNV